MEKKTYPRHMQLGSDLLSEVDGELSCVVVSGAEKSARVVGYLLVETDGNEAYVSDIVRTKECTVYASEMLMWLLGRLADRPEIGAVTAECRSTSVHLIEAAGLEVVERQAEWCPWRSEEMTSVRVRLPAR